MKTQQHTNIHCINFNKLCDEWVIYKKPRIKESTYSNYTFKMNKYLRKEFGEKSLYELLSYDMNKYVEKLQLKFSSKTIRDIMTVLKSILRYAERKYDIDFKLDLISSPLLYKKEVEIFNDRDKKKLEKYLLASSDIKSLGILISLFSGMRIGEICSLKWSDIDFDKNIINVNHTLQRVYLGKKDTKVVITVPKTKKSIRKIPLSKVLSNKLKPISKEYPKNAFVLTGLEDKFVEPLGYRYTYKIILNACHISYKKFHCLRHTFATKCVAVGMDIKSLSEVLGHANVNVTLDIYVHSSYKVKKKFIDKL